MAKKNNQKKNQRIIAIFKEEQLVLDYTKLRDQIGLDKDGVIRCNGKYRVYSGKQGSGYPLNLESVILFPARALNGYVYVGYTDRNGDYHELESDILIAIDDEMTEAVFFHPTAVANTYIYDNENIGEKL